MPSPTLEYYTNLWANCLVETDPASISVISYFYQQAVSHKEIYLTLERELGVPWPLIAGIHGRESSFNFRTCLHNGDPLGRKTTHVPQGRGPFTTWHDAATDALKLKNLNTIKHWPIEECLRQAELYNGLGYYKYHPGHRSPYLWSQTNQYSGGLYKSDGHFDPIARDHNCGIAAFMKKLIDRKEWQPQA